MQTLKDLLTHFLQSSDVWQEKLIREWPEFVGELHTRMRLERIMQDTLYVGVYDVRWLHELHCLSVMLTAHINKKLGADHVKKIIFRPAKQKKRIVKTPYEENVSALEQHLTQREKSVLDEIKDEELQNALREYRLKCH
jgi:hypothetical protein